MPTTVAIAIMARVPSKSAGKSRLRAVLGPEWCLELQRAFLLDAVDLASSVDGADVYVACHPPNRVGALRQLVGQDVPAIPQMGADLGERMWHVAAMLRQWHPSVILMGTDSPTLQPGVLRDALEALEQHDVCLGPSLDGGYYLIGLKVAAAPLFANVDWGTGEVLAQTIRNVERAGLTYRLLEPWYDVDAPPDLQRLRADLARLAAEPSAHFPRHTAAVLEKLAAAGLL